VQSGGKRYGLPDTLIINAFQHCILCPIAVWTSVTVLMRARGVV